MASQAEQLHFVMFPFMLQGHMIPMIDIAKLLAQRGMIITIVTTPVNAARFEKILSRAKDSGLQIHLVHLKFPCEEAGLPQGCENYDMLSREDMGRLTLNFYHATNLLLEQAQDLFQQLTPKPSCIVSDMCLPYTIHVSNKFQIPRIVFHGVGCFCLLCMLKIHSHKVFENVTSDLENVVVPGLPDKMEFNKLQVPFSGHQMWEEMYKQMAAAEQQSYGVVVNTFEDLEPEYVKEYRKSFGKKIWCIGPVSLYNRHYLDKAQRGNKASIDEQQCLKWLDMQKNSSVVYACLGSLSNLTASQLVELGSGLEASNRPFIWVIRGGDVLNEIEKWLLGDGFEKKIKGRGLLIRGWAPQVLILSHPAIGGFLTHCGWNSTLEGISAGLPLITWPLFGDQFCNERLIMQVLKIAVSVGVELPNGWGQEEIRVKKEDVKKAVEMLMDEGEEGEARRERVKKLGEMAKRAVEEGGSSDLNTSQLIQDIMQHASEGKLLV